MLNISPGGMPWGGSGLISQVMGAGAGGADTMAGGMLARGMAIGGPMAQAGMGMMGWDPMSMGMSAASRVWGMGGGVMGAGMAGMGVAAGVGGAMAMGGFAANQMYQGAQGQAQLNQGMRQNYNFINQQGGQGFTGQQSSNIGGMLHHMSHEVGAGGEMASFGELSKLAQNMGKMGMAQNVQTVGDFKEKFKTMVDTLKKVATDLGSSLEDAQKAILGMKNSGIFNKGDQLKMSGGMKANALAGGLAMSEVSGMASIGSQISRSVGGLGSSGAFGGMKAITQVGTAMQVGALSEEDIYNATGQNGAEGRQALAANMMSSSAQFLKSGRGRRMLASMAGKDGKLDEASAAEWMQGGMTTGRTMEMAGQNLNKVGRENFIRNEGRLRGAALEKFGGMAQTMAYQQWLSSRGIDANNMDDRAMLGFQRFSGMDRDGADAAIKMVQSLPDQLKRMRESKGEQAYSEEVGLQKKNSGLQGIKNKVDQTREKIQSHLQKAGSDIFSEGSEVVSQWFNKTMGIYEKRVSEDITQALRVMQDGGAAGKQARHETFGGASGMAGSKELLKGTNLQTSAGNQAAKRQEKELRGMISAAKDADVDALHLEFMKNNKESFQDLYTSSAAEKQGAWRMADVGDYLKKKAASGGQAEKEMYDRYKNGNMEQRAALVSSMEKIGGIHEEAGIANTFRGPKDKLEKQGRFNTEGEANEHLGKGLRGKEEKGYLQQAGDLGIDALAVTALGFLGTAEMAGHALFSEDGFGDGKSVYEMTSLSRDFINDARGRAKGDKKKDRLAGDYARSKEGRRLLQGVAEGDDGAGRSKMQRLKAQKGKGELDEAGEAALAVLETGMAGREIGQMIKLKNKSPEQMNDAEKKELIEKVKEKTGKDMSFDEIVAAGRGTAEALEEGRIADTHEAVERKEKDLSQQKDTAIASGIAKKGKNGDLELSSEGAKGLDGASKEATELYLKQLNTKFSGDADEDRDTYNKMLDTNDAMLEKISGMGMAEKQKLAKGNRGNDLGSMAGESIMREQKLSSLEKAANRQLGGGKGGKELALAKSLGIDIDKDMAGKLAGSSSQDAVAMLTRQMGITGDDDKSGHFREGLTKALELQKQGKTGQAADLIAQTKGGASDDIKKKLEAAKEGKDDPGTAAQRKTAENTKVMIDLLKVMTGLQGVTNDELAKQADGKGEGTKHK